MYGKTKNIRLISVFSILLILFFLLEGLIKFHTVNYSNLKDTNSKTKYEIIFHKLRYNYDISLEGLEKVETDSIKEIVFLNEEESIKYFLYTNPKLYAMYHSYKEIVKELKWENNRIYFIMSNGEEFLFDDYKEKNEEELTNNPDLEDVFTFEYPYGEINKIMDTDPGSYLSSDFLKSVYGYTENEVISNCELVNFLGTKLLFNKKNKASFNLKKVIADLEKLVDKDKSLRKYLKNIGGSFNWRYIRGTKRMSKHSFAIAIDISVRYSSYWQWYKDKWEDKTYSQINKPPYEIVKAFEDHGFIWGGKWKHYDTMHFEYRPEILVYYNKYKAE